MRAATHDIELGRGSAVNDFLACVGASDSRVLFANIVRNIEKRDTTLLFVFVNRYYDTVYCDDSRLADTITTIDSLCGWRDEFLRISICYAET